MQPDVFIALRCWLYASSLRGGNLTVQLTNHTQKFTYDLIAVLVVCIAEFNRS